MPRRSALLTLALLIAMTITDAAAQTQNAAQYRTGAASAAALKPVRRATT